ncbi:MAG: preprotein translocase subunit YajC [Gammaproteobacteria bacterium]
MDFFISNAMAGATGGAAATPGIAEFLPLILLFVIFYFMLIRPQMKRAKEHKNLVGSLEKGDEVITNGGLLGKITDLGENFISIEIASGTEVKLQRTAITAVMPKGTIKTL